MSETTDLESEAAGLSYLRGAAVPLLNLTLSQALTETARKFPDREALVVCHEGVRLTWSELDREVTRTARGIAGLGLRPGHRAGIWASNCVEWVLLQYAAPRAGVILVNVNPASRAHELRYVLAKSHIRALFLPEKDSRANYRAILEECRTGDRLPLEHVVWLGEESWHAMIAGGTDFPKDAATPDDVVNIQYTSGTTGSPKGAMLTHRNLLNNGMAMGMGLKATEKDRICAPVPLYHCFGSVNPVNREEYIDKVLSAYRRTPGTAGTIRRPDRLLAAQLHERGVPLMAAENALVLAAARRMIRPAGSPPLGTIRSLAYFLPVLAYFLPVIEEVLSLNVSPGYFQYLRHKIERPVQTR